MARLVVHTAKRPYRHTTPKGEDVWICMCGFSNKYPICDGKHRVFVAEPDEKILAYDQEANKIEIQIPEEIANKLRKV